AVRGRVTGGTSELSLNHACRTARIGGSGTPRRVQGRKGHGRAAHWRRRTAGSRAETRPLRVSGAPACFVLTQPVVAHRGHDDAEWRSAPAEEGGSRADAHTPRFGEHESPGGFDVRPHSNWFRMVSGAGAPSRSTFIG